MGAVWHDQPEDLHEWLLRLTESFDLTFPHPDEPYNLVPCLLSMVPPQVIIISIVYLYYPCPIKRIIISILKKQISIFKIFMVILII